MACNTVEVKVNGVTTFCGIGCVEPGNWYVDSAIIVKRGQRRFGLRLMEGLPDHDTAWRELNRIAREGWNGEIK